MLSIQWLAVSYWLNGQARRCSIGPNTVRESLDPKPGRLRSLLIASDWLQNQRSVETKSF